MQIVEVYPYIEYIKYLLAGSIAMSIFIVAMIGGGITFIDDKARGLHEGYLVTPITKADLILGLIFSGAIKGLMAGTTITIIGGLIAGIDRLWDPVRLFYLVIVLGTTSLAMISFMFLLMVRVSDPLVPRAIFGVLNTLLFFPSGAIYPVEGFPFWLRWISFIDPFTYAVHALKALLLKNTGFSGDLFGCSDSVRVFRGAGQPVCRIFQEADLRCRRRSVRGPTRFRRGRTKIKSAALRHQRSGAGIFLIAVGTLVSCFAIRPEKHTVEHFMDAVVAGNPAGLSDLASARELFLSRISSADLGTDGYYSPMKSYRIESAECRRRAAAAWWSSSRSARYDPFPNRKRRSKRRAIAKCSCGWSAPISR